MSTPVPFLSSSVMTGVIASPTATASPTADLDRTAMVSAAPIASIISSSSLISTVIGDGLVLGSGGVADFGDGGPAITAHLNQPSDLAIASDGTLFILDKNNERVRQVSRGTISTIAGGGTQAATESGLPAASISISIPKGLVLEKCGDLLIVDKTSRILLISRTTGNSFGRERTSGFAYLLFAPASAADSQAISITACADGTAYLADSAHNRVWLLDSSGNPPRPFAGTGTIASASVEGGDGGPALAAAFGGVNAVSSDAAGNVYVTENNQLRPIRMVCRTAGSYFGQAMTVGRIYTIGGKGPFTPIGSTDIGDRGQSSNVDGSALLATFFALGKVTFDPAGNAFLKDNLRIRRIDRLTGIINTVVGGGLSTPLGDNGQAGLAGLKSPASLVFDLDGSLLIADTGNHRIRKVIP